MAAASDRINTAGIHSFADSINQKQVLRKQKTIRRSKSEENQTENQEDYETIALERAIVKIGSLLALGFGEAGAGIIGQNMNVSGDIDPMQPGQRTHAIFGFCILDKFIECTEVLGSDIMTYVNRVAEVTHSMVDRYGGATNKNIGEAFLLVWKFHDTKQLQLMDEVSGEYNNKDLCHENIVIADMAVFSFLKIIAKLNKYDHILEYAENEDLLQKVDEDFKCKMGFGLHQGWAIEGAIGSHFKVDASYLSPNVNMAARLEAATKQFGTQLLISGHMRDIMSDNMQSICREIDTVTVKGSIKPMRLFTIDIQTEDLVSQKDPITCKNLREKKIIRDKVRDENLNIMFEGDHWEVLNKDPDFIELRKYVDPEFEALFAKTYKQYIAGDWQSASYGLQELLEMRPDDGPTVNLNKVVNIQGGGEAPSNWKGYRALTSK